MRTLLHWTLIATLLGCAGKSSTDSGADTAASQRHVDDNTVQATMLVLNATDGSSIEGVTVESPTGLIESTDADGATSFPVEAGGTFLFTLRQGGAIDHVVFGPTGSEDFVYQSFLATESMLSMVNGLLGTTQEDGTGIMVVIIDDDDTQAAVGATASIGADHSDSWIMTTGTPSFGDTIPEGGNGVLVFPNIAPGETSVSVTPPEGSTCSAFPGGGQMPNPPVLINHITIVTFHCRN